LGDVPKELAPDTYRPLANVLWKTLLDPTERRHQIILGPRRVGKTTVMYQTVRELLAHGIQPSRVWWLRLDHPLLMDRDLGNLVEQIMAQSEATPLRPTYVFLDELTYAERWDLWLKTFFDERWPVRIVGTSSATAAIRQRGTESGVGRWDEQYLAPYLFTEYLALRGTPFVAPCEATLSKTIARAISEPWPVQKVASAARRRFLLTGGFPELLLVEPKADEASELLRSQRLLRNDAIEKALFKDIPQAFSLDDPTKLERLLYVLGGQIAGLLSPNSVATDLGVAPKTVERYISYLERAFIVFLLNNYAANEETIQRRGKKLFFVDGAVRNAALLRGAMPIDNQTEMGLLIENLAASHLRSLAYQESVRLYHWRQKDREVDLVYDHPDEPLAFELGSSPDHHVKGLHVFQERFPKFKGKCYVVTPDSPSTMPSEDRPGSLPLDTFLVAVGHQEQRALENRVGRTAKTEGGQLLLF